jgi:hypothetical protein
MTIRQLALGLCAAVSLAPAASAADKPLRDLFAGSKTPKAPHPYPLSDRHYIKQFAAPTIGCGSCFGYHATQWRSWAEACHEPQIVEPGPQRVEAPVEPVPAVPPIEKPREKPPAPKQAKPMEPAKPAPKKAEPKPNKKVELPTLIPAPAPVIVMSPMPFSVPTKAEIVVPSIPVAKPIPMLNEAPATVLPTIIVPLESK